MSRGNLDFFEKIRPDQLGVRRNVDLSRYPAVCGGERDLPAHDRAGFFPDRVAEVSDCVADPVVVAVDIGGESGFFEFKPPGGVHELFRDLYGDDFGEEQRVTPEFDCLRDFAFEPERALRDELEGAYPSLDLSELSCGMSEDFEAALEEGSTLIRLGRVVFDPAFELE